MNMFTVCLEDSYAGIQKEIRQKTSREFQLLRGFPLTLAGYETCNIEPDMRLWDV